MQVAFLVHLGCNLAAVAGCASGDSPRGVAIMTAKVSQVSPAALASTLFAGPRFAEKNRIILGAVVGMIIGIMPAQADSTLLFQSLPSLIASQVRNPGPLSICSACSANF